MRVKEYLSQAIYLQKKIIRCEEQIEEIRSRMQSAGAIRYDKVNIMQSPSNDAMANYIIQLEKAEKASRELQSIYYATYAKIQEQIEMIDPPIMSTILGMRWLDGKDLATIADELSYSYEYVRHMHGDALKAFDKKFIHLNTQ